MGLHYKRFFYIYVCKTIVRLYFFKIRLDFNKIGLKYDKTSPLFEHEKVLKGAFFNYKVLYKLCQRMQKGNLSLTTSKLVHLCFIVSI